MKVGCRLAFRNVSSTVDAGFTAGRCSAREGAGARAAELVSWRATPTPNPDAKTIVLKLKEPYGLVLESIANPSSYVPFICRSG